MRSIPALALLASLTLTAPAHAAPRPMEDWRRAMACQAHVTKLADQNEQGYRSYVDQMRRDPKRRSQAGQVERTEKANVSFKRSVAEAARRGAERILDQSYDEWRSADPALPARRELVAREEAAARQSAGRLDTPQQLLAAVGTLKCEELLVASSPAREARP